MIDWDVPDNLREMADLVKDRFLRRGADFARWVEPEALGLDSRRSNRYQPTPDSLRRVLKELDVIPGESMLDVGCGKGKAMYLMHRLPFANIDGFDFSPELVAIANQNFQLLGCERCHAFVADANIFSGYDDYDWLYLFNPFRSIITQRMMEQVEASLERNPRRLSILYFNPMHDAEILRRGTFARIWRREARIAWQTAVVYRNRGYR